jgi:hypothetical protein
MRLAGISTALVPSGRDSVSLTKVRLPCFNSDIRLAFISAWLEIGQLFHVADVPGGRLRVTVVRPRVGGNAGGRRGNARRHPCSEKLRGK